MMRPRTTLVATALLTAVAASAWGQTLGGGGASADIAWGRMLLALVLCLALAIGGAFVLRTRLRSGAPLPLGWPWAVWSAARNGEKPARRLRLLESVRTGPQVNISLMSCDGREFIVAASSQGVAIMPLDGGSRG